MLEQANVTARLRATVEEELGAFRHFADVPSKDLEAMAARLVRAIEPFVVAAAGEEISRAA